MSRLNAKLAATAFALAASFAGQAFADTPDKVKAHIAHAVYKSSAHQVHNERPQPLLRAVVVLRVKLDADNKWHAEVFRDNPHQPEMTQLALESVSKLPVPTGLSQKSLDILRGEGVIEAWLFQTDGRFALKTLAKPQRGA